MENKLPVYETDYNRNNKRKKSMFKPYWNDILRDQWNKACVSERKWLKHSGSNSEKRKLKDSYCTERKQFDRMNRKFKRRYQNNERQKLEDKLYSSNQRDFWRSIGKVGICNERKSCIPNSVVNEDGTIETDKVNVLDRWKEDFRQLFNSDENNDETIPHSEESQNVHRDITELNEPITREEVITAVTRAKVRKATGIDDILKNDTAIELLYQILSGCFQLGKVPLEWTRGIINPILKPNADDERIPLNYRGITLISVPCKIYCIILNQRISKWLEDNNHLCEEQNGFRKGRSCEEHIQALYLTLNDRKISRLSTHLSDGPMLINCLERNKPLLEEFNTQVHRFDYIYLPKYGFLLQSYSSKSDDYMKVSF
ncbi:unnamed protein product [Mytilus coruscus]|uniref:Reverse transcriptase domain-containing protein n=1 Tax=Mytilus coruscus TaxID=42192 RepID=A0A6J8D1F7_MYTCO|nr:unnamed protein product [Mytilus coruscus]